MEEKEKEEKEEKEKVYRDFCSFKKTELMSEVYKV